MKIIEKKTYKDWKRQFMCNRCESTLEAEHEDISAHFHEGWSDPRNGSGQSSYWTYDCRCAVCGEGHVIPEDCIPKILQHESQQRYQRSKSNYFEK